MVEESRSRSIGSIFVRVAAWLALLYVLGSASAPLIEADGRWPGLPTMALTIAHEVAGTSWHRTFPAWLPVWGVDHALGNAHVEFSRYQTLDLGVSDHLAQLFSFGLVASGG